MNSFFSKTFGGLTRAYYLRQLAFGSIFTIFIVIMNFKMPNTNYGLVFASLILTLLYPYSRFVYEQVVGYVVGGNVFFVNALFMLIVKLFTMTLCWSFAYIIAPVGLIYLYFYNSRATAE